MSEDKTPTGPLTTKMIEEAELLLGLSFTDPERDQMLKSLNERLENLENLRSISMDNSVAPAHVFSPILPGYNLPHGDSNFTISNIDNVERSSNLEEVAFYPITKLSKLIQSKQVSSLELTEMYLERLKRFDPQLKCVVNLTEDLAIRQANQADDEIANGKIRGPLHGIPWGAKDLLATKDYPTTWGATPFKNQILDYDAAVVERLSNAGAVLVAKLTLGALAWGDVWFDGVTKNPWDLEVGSSGSSAGPASATAAGLVGFSIGSETLGSIVSPSHRCGVTGLRPTFGRVSKFGAMALSWSMDKLGPICRSVEDCALVFNSIHGTDGRDLSVIDAPFTWNPESDIKKIKIGYVESAFDEERETKDFDDSSLETLKSLGANLIPIELPKLPYGALRMILLAEAAAAFDELTRSNEDDLLVSQIDEAWPNFFRAARFIPAVEYIQASRVRTLAMQEMAKLFEDIDVYICPSFGTDNLTLTNLTGHPCVVIPNGFSESETPSSSISLTGNLFEEGNVLAVAKAIQDASDFHNLKPSMNYGS
jgi:Asp-tRNA(Asn)/Glu-tRNA(Gln) amidotransferase A subunit family amidase